MGAPWSWRGRRSLADGPPPREAGSPRRRWAEARGTGVEPRRAPGWRIGGGRPSIFMLFKDGVVSKLVGSAAESGERQASKEEGKASRTCAVCLLQLPAKIQF
jgi:hypothetical protein